MILIVGASSSIGQAVIPLLVNAGYALRLASRTPEKLAPFAGKNVEIVQADLLDEASIRRACTGVRTVFASVASLFGRGKNAARYVDLEGQCRLIDIAKVQGVEHFVYMSTLEATHDNPVSFFRYKAQTEDYLRASRLTYTVLRASAFFEPHATLIGEGVLKGRSAWIMGRGDNLRNFVVNEDVAHLAFMALTKPQAHNQTISIGGPENLSSKQVAEIYARAAGVQLKTQTIPRFVPRAMSRLMKPFHPGLADVMGAIIDADTRNKTFDPSSTLAQYPIPLTRLEDWVRAQVK